MSLQLFSIEFSVDFLIYFLFWLTVVLFIKRFFTQYTISKPLTRVNWALAILTISFWCLILTISEKHIKVKRDWGMQVLTTGYKFTLTNKDRPTFSKYDSLHYGLFPTNP